MNPAIHAAIIAAEAQKPGVDDLVRTLRKARATSASSAISLPDADQAKIDEAIGLGLINRSADGRLHTNESAVADRAQSQGWIIMAVLLVAASVIASLIALLTS